MILTLAAAARAEDAKTLLNDLTRTSSRPGALARLDKLPLSSLAEVAEAAFDDQRPEEVRKVLLQHLPALYTRLRNEFNEEDQTLRRAWVKGVLEQGYRSSSRTNARWDALAMSALVYLDSDEEGFNRYKAAMEAGANNRIIETMYQIRGLELRKLDAVKAGPALDSALGSFNGSPHPDASKFWVRLQLCRLMNSLNWPAEFNSKLKFADEVDKLYRLFPKFVASNPGNGLISDSVNSLWAFALVIEPTPKAAFERLSPVLEGPLNNGDHYLYKRTRALSLMREGQRLATAEPAIAVAMSDQAVRIFIDGWRLDPLDARTCEYILNAGYDRLSAQDVETFVKFGILADPNHVGVRQAKLNLLLNKGTETEALTWALQCFKDATPRNRVGMILIEAVRRVADKTEDPQAFLQKPPIWKHVESVYELMLSDLSRAAEDREGYFRDRRDYLRMALHARHWQAYLTLSEKFGEEIGIEAYGKEMYDYSQRFAKAQLELQGITPLPAAQRIVLPPSLPRTEKFTPSDEPVVKRRNQNNNDKPPANALEGLP